MRRLYREEGDDSPALDDEPMILAAPAPQALDVERLQRAMEKAAATLRFAYGDGNVPGFGVAARETAAEYARLSRLPSETER